MSPKIDQKINETEESRNRPTDMQIILFMIKVSMQFNGGKGDLFKNVSTKYPH